jgi:beta-glucosidase
MRPERFRQLFFPAVYVILTTFIATNSPLLAQTVEDRISAILSQMTIAEKIKQLHAEGGFNTADNTRLSVPGFIMSDGPHGVRDGLATSFPVGIGMASTWDVDLAQRVGHAMGEEFRGKGKHQALGPCLDLDRDPRNGRSPETGGEDPFLCAQITTAVVKGIQSTPCIATVKHYNANHRETNRTSNNIIATQRVLHEHNGLAFRTAVQQGGAFSVMNAYNLINGQKCAENSALLTTTLRTHWGFPYYVVSDWGSIWSSENAIKAGCDICMGSDNYKNDLPSLVSSGAVPMEVIDQAVRRVLRTKILAGMLDYLPPGNPDDVNSKAHQQLCLEAGRKSLVLLKNQDNILPLNAATINTIALIGPSAAVTQIDGSGSAYVSPFYTVTPKQGIEAKTGVNKVFYSKGCDINSSDVSGFNAAVALAQASDVVIYCGGLDPSQEGEGFDRVGGSIDLPGKQQDLINALSAANRNLIVVLFSGGVCGINRCVDNVKGLLYAFYPGQEGGNAVADVLFGDYNPGGRLPVTMPKTDAQLPAWNDNFNDDYGGGYRWFDEMHYTPQFAFGYGLSYTTFSYSNLSITPTSAAPGQLVTVSVDVTNTGSRNGDEVVQLYLTDTTSTVPMPVKQVKAFRRITLSPAQTANVKFTLTADELYYFNESNSSYQIEPGEYTVRIGGSSDILPLVGTFQITDGPYKPDLLITNVKMVPPYPQPGQQVVFLATVKNQGSVATTAGNQLKVTFSVDGQQTSWSDDFKESIPAGGMALLCANSGPGGLNRWTAGGLGTYSIEATADPDNAIDECVETNNAANAQLTVYPTPPQNLALNKAVTVSSIEAAGLEGPNAVDGNMGTRWSSAFSDPQSISVDLGALHHIDDVTIYWETAYGKEYELQISDGASGWTTVRHETNSDGGIDKISVAANAQAVKLIGMQRATAWGYSIYEMQVHGGAPTAIGASTVKTPSDYSLENNFPNPFNPSTTIRYGIPTRSRVRVDVTNVLGQKVAELVNSEKEAGFYQSIWSAEAPSGIYFLHVEAIPLNGRYSRFDDVKKMILLK